MACLSSVTSVAATGLVAHYRLDETAGATATDASGNGNHGTFVSSPTLGVSGVNSNAVDFDGTGPHVLVPNSPSLAAIGNANASFTVAFWLKLNEGSDGSFRSIIHKGNVSEERTFGMWLRPDNNRIHYRITTSTNPNSGGNSTQPIPVGTWTHITYVYNNNGGTLRFYLNGNFDSNTFLGGTVVGNSGPLYLGSTPWSPGLNAGLDDVRVYNRALSSEEVGLLYESFSSALVGHWKLDETSGTVAADSSGNGNDGTLLGNPTWTTQGIRTGSLDFETSDGVDRVDAGNFDVVAAGLTLAAWIRQENPLSDSRIIFKSNGDLAANQSWGLTVDENGELDMRLNAGGTWTRLQAPGVIDSDKWHHVAGTYDGTTMRLYVDGHMIASRAHLSGGVIAGNSGHTVSLGDSVTGNRSFDGLIDDARVYNRGLNDQEIAELYGLVGHWNMDEGAGTTAADGTVFANHATLSGATWTTDCTGNSGLEFDGLGDTAATNAVFDPPENGSIAVWLRSAGNPGARSRPFGLGGNWEIRQEPDGTLSFDLGAEGPDEGAGPDAFVTTEGLSFVDRWYHLVAQFKATDDSFEIYINGELVNSGVNGDDMVKQLANTLTFGTRTGSAEYWEGGMRDFRVYNRWLAGSEISTLSGLVAYWKFDETSGTVAVDSSPNGHDGTFATGNPVWTTAGNINGALDFESSDGADRVDVGTFDISGSELSISAWILTEDDGDDLRVIIKSSGNTQANQFWGLTAAESDEPDFRIKAGGTLDRVLHTGVICSGKWYHLAGTYNGTTMRLYLNGVEVASKNHLVGGAIDEDSTVPVTIGDSPVGSRAFDGRLDEIRVFNRVLCPEEVFGQYKDGRPPGIRILKWVEVR